MEIKKLSVKESYEQGRKEASTGQSDLSVGLCKRIPSLVGYVLEKISQLDFSLSEVEVSKKGDLSYLLANPEAEKILEEMQEDLSIQQMQRNAEFYWSISQQYDWPFSGF